MKNSIVLFFILAGLVMPSYAEPLDEFVADYNVYYGDYKLGEGVYTLTHIEDDEYLFNFKSKMRFLLVFSDKRDVDVSFEYKDQQVLPIKYTHNRKGTGRDYVDLIEFDRSKNQIHSEHDDEIYQQNYDAEVRDGLSAQMQLFIDLQQGNKTPSYPILEANKVKRRYFEFVREEEVEVHGRKYNTVVYQVVRDKKKRRTMMWFSVDHNYQPVRMVHFDKDKKKFNAELTYFGFKQDKVAKGVEKELEKETEDLGEVASN